MKTQTKKVDLITQGKEYWQLVLHRKWVALLAGTLLSATAIVAIALMPAWYAASITVSVDPQKMPDRYVSSSVTADQLRFDNLSEQVLNTPRLQQIINDLNLYPALRSTMSQQEIIEYMRKNILVQVKQGGDRNLSAFTIKFSDKDRQLVAKVATRLAQSFIDWDLAMRQHQAVGASKFLAGQLGEAKTRLDDQEARINGFRRQHLGELPEQAAANSATLNRLQVELQGNIDNLNRLEQEKLLLSEGAPSARSDAAPRTERARLEDQQRKLTEQLTELRSHYSDEYPDVAQTSDRLALVKQQLAQLPADQGQAHSAQAGVTNAPNNTRLQITNNEIKRLQAEQKDILAKIDQYQAKVDAAPLREQELDELGRDYRNSTTRYQSLLDKKLTAEMAQELELTRDSDRFSILEPAEVPDKPFKPHRLRWILMAVPGCFLFAAFLVVFSDLAVCGSISTERALKALLPTTIPVIGRIPQIETPTSNRRGRQVAVVAIGGSLICCLLVALLLMRIHSRNGRANASAQGQVTTSQVQ